MMQTYICACPPVSWGLFENFDWSLANPFTTQLYSDALVPSWQSTQANIHIRKLIRVRFNHRLRAIPWQMSKLSTWWKKNFFSSDIDEILAGNVHKSSCSTAWKADKMILTIWHFSQWGKNGCLMAGVPIIASKGWVFSQLCHIMWNPKVFWAALLWYGGRAKSSNEASLTGIGKVSHRKLPHVLIAQVHNRALPCVSHSTHSPAYCTLFG